MAKKKAPAFQFYVRDWLSEPEVRRLSLASRGIWIDILAYMWLEEEQGKLEAGIPELARMCGASESEIQAFLCEAERVDLCSVSRFCPGDVPACPENVQLVSRRMHREWKDREYERLRKQKQRASSKCPENVPAPSSSASAFASALDTKTSSSKLSKSSSPTKRTPEDFLGEGDPPSSRPVKTDSPSKGRSSRQGFLACWQVYPLKQGEEAAWREWCRLEDNNTLEEPWAIREHIQLMAQEDGRFTRCPPKFENYLRDKRWNDTPYKAPQEGPTLVSGMPQAKTQAQQNAQNRQRLAKALNQARSQRENQQRQNARGNCSSGFELPGGDDGTGRNCGFAPDLGGGPRALERKAVS